MKRQYTRPVCEAFCFRCANMLASSPNGGTPGAPDSADIYFGEVGSGNAADAAVRGSYWGDDVW